MGIGAFFSYVIVGMMLGLVSAMILRFMLSRTETEDFSNFSGGLLGFVIGAFWPLLFPLFLGALLFMFLYQLIIKAVKGISLSAVITNGDNKKKKKDEEER